MKTQIYYKVFKSNKIIKCYLSRCKKIAFLLTNKELINQQQNIYLS